MSKAAIVIGVNKTGGLTPLKAAVSGAKEFAEWIKGEGFDVHLFVDEPEPARVRVSEIFDTTKSLIDTGILEQIVVYFSGHGFMHNYSEFWMLSGAPDNPAEAICVRENIELAKESGTNNVVFISDACRSVPKNFRASNVKGSWIFPNLRVSQGTRPKIDKFYATLPSDPALEMKIDENAMESAGVFTYCFLQAFKEPYPDMIRQIESEGRKIQVVPNRRLEEYLMIEVPALIQKRNALLTQRPEINVPSNDDTYIGQYRPSAGRVSMAGTPRLATASPVTDVQDIARVAVAREIGMDGEIPEAMSEAVDRIADDSSFARSVNFINETQAEGSMHFETETGFKVFGADVVEAYAVKRQTDVFARGNDDEATHIRLYQSPSHDENVTSVIIRFADGSGTVLAGLDGYIGTVAVEESRVVNVSYTPSDNNWRWGDYQYDRERLESLRAVVASAARYGVFRVNENNAARIADSIRMMKSVDPSLGLYASYAYAEADEYDEVDSVVDYMVGDLEGAVLFDIAMLAGYLTDESFIKYHRIVPFCPMLSQGWTMLRVRQVDLPDFIEEASTHMLTSLWTTFDKTGMDIIVNAMNEGRIQ